MVLCASACHELFHLSQPGIFAIITSMLAMTMRMRVYRESLFSYQAEDSKTLAVVVVPSEIMPVAGTSRPSGWTSSLIISSIWEEDATSTPVATLVGEIQMKCGVIVKRDRRNTLNCGDLFRWWNHCRNIYLHLFL